MRRILARGRNAIFGLILWKGRTGGGGGHAGGDILDMADGIITDMGDGAILDMSAT